MAAVQFITTKAMKVTAMDSIDLIYKKYCRIRFPLPSEAQVTELEGRIGNSFSLEYRYFLLNYNGGFFNNPSILQDTKEKSDEKLVFLSGINATDSFAEIASPANLSLFEDNEPIQVLPVGYTSYNSLLILIVHEENKGSIILKKSFEDEYEYISDNIINFFSLLE